MVREGIKRAGLRFVLLASGLAFVGSLAVNAPSKWAADQLGLNMGLVQLWGTVWRGGASLSPGVEASWVIDPGASLVSLRLKGEAVMTAPGLAATGDWALQEAGLELSGLSGQANWDLVRALAPEVEVECDLVLKFEDAELLLRPLGAEIQGEGRTMPGACRGARLPTPAATPSTIVSVRGGKGKIRARAALAERPEETLLDLVRSADGHLRLTISATAQNLMGTSGATGPIELEVRRP